MIVLPIAVNQGTNMQTKTCSLATLMIPKGKTNYNEKECGGCFRCSVGQEDTGQVERESWRMNSGPNTTGLPAENFIV